MFQEVPIINLSIKRESKWKYENKQLLKRIKEIESKRRYGAIKIHCHLIKEGFSVSLKYVQRLMKLDDLTPIIQKNIPLINNLKNLF